ncbi:HAMP domain-containing histidine kinase [Cohnella terricola]|uniref:Heme sensor protein HssS n=2 Tax=Cohnella terricola TaxID=1289167 RepID=A0A559JXN1_9BACL|nr:HAMP domain-containing histidine kinase [Cohnella terricola]
MLSLVLSFVLNDRLIGDRLKQYVQGNMIGRGKTIIQAYEQYDPSNRDALMTGLMALPNYSVRLIDEEGKLLHGTSMPSGPHIEVLPDQLDLVLKGGVYRDSGRHGFRSTVGLPLRIDDKPYALFLTSEFGDFARMLSGFFRNLLLIVLLFGSFFILISARYIVRPLRRLTEATRKMSKGDFSIRLRTKRKDEIGQLTESFNQMAHELGTLEHIRQQFVSDVSHEIQSPLTSIKGFTQALKHKKMDEAGRLRLLDIIEDESNRLSRLSNDLLQLASLEYEHLALNVKPFRLDEQIRNVIIASEPQWAAKKLDIELELGEIRIAADEDKLKQVWMNLLSNSIKFTGEHGRISIKANAEDGEAEVVVTDDGQGISDEEIGSIFKPFYKVDKSRDRAIGGNGIGLSIVKRIVDLHRGDIHVTSKVGEWTTFRVILPLTAPPNETQKNL